MPHALPRPAADTDAGRSTEVCGGYDARMTRSLPQGVEIDPPASGWETPGGIDEVLTDEALAFVADLQRRVGRPPGAILEARVFRPDELHARAAPHFSRGPADIRSADLK